MLAESEILGSDHGTRREKRPGKERNRGDDAHRTHLNSGSVRRIVADRAARGEVRKSLRRKAVGVFGMHR